MSIWWVFAGQLLHELSFYIAAVSYHENGSILKMVFIDPLYNTCNKQSLLYNINVGQKVKPLIPTSNPDSEVVDMGPFQLKLKEEKVPLNKVTQAQYLEGSMKILQEMIMKDKC